MLTRRISSNLLRLHNRTLCTMAPKDASFGSLSGYDPRCFVDPVSVESELILKDFNTNYKYSKVNSIFEVRNGCYLSVDADDISKKFPEGLAGSTSEDFANFEPSWMIREPTKLFSLMLNEFDKKFNKNVIDSTAVSSVSTTKQVFNDKTLPRFDNIKELEDAKLKVYSFSPHNNHYLSPEVTRTEDNLSSFQSGEGSNLELSIKNLTALTNDGIPKNILLNGPGGSGRSTLLNQIVLDARNRDWLVLFVPNGYEQTHGGEFVDPIDINQPAQYANLNSSIENPEDLQSQLIQDQPFLEFSTNKFNVITKTGDDGLKKPSLTEKNYYDNALLSADVLRKFLIANRSKLSQIKIRNREILSKYEKTLVDFKDLWQRVSTAPGRGHLNFYELRAILLGNYHDPVSDELDLSVLPKNFNINDIKFETLEDLILLPIILNKLYGACFIDLINELKEVDEFPVLIAVDDYNLMLSKKTPYKYNDREIQANEICVPSALEFIKIKKEENKNEKNYLKNGIFIGSNSSNHQEVETVNFSKYLASLPLTVEVPIFNKTESLSFVMNSLNNNLIDKTISIHDIYSYKMYTQSIPKEMKKGLINYFLPRSAEVIHDRNSKILSEVLTPIERERGYNSVIYTDRLYRSSSRVPVKNSY